RASPARRTAAKRRGTAAVRGESTRRAAQLAREWRRRAHRISETRTHGQPSGSLESSTRALRRVRARRGECAFAARRNQGSTLPYSLRLALRARRPRGLAAHEARAARRGLGAPL